MGRTVSPNSRIIKGEDLVARVEELREDADEFGMTTPELEAILNFVEDIVSHLGEDITYNTFIRDDYLEQYVKYINWDDAGDFAQYVNWDEVAELARKSPSYIYDNEIYYLD